MCSAYCLLEEHQRERISVIIPSPFSTTKENPIYLNEEEVFNHTRQLQDGWVLKEPIHSIEQCRVCMYITEAYFLISYTCQAKYLVLTHGVFDIYLQL